MKKRILTLFMAITVLAMTTVGVFAAPAPEKANTSNQVVKAEDLKAKETSLELVELTIEDFKELEANDFEFIPVLISQSEEDGTIRNYWVIMNEKHELIFKAEEIEIDKYVVAKKGLNMRTSPAIITELTNRFKAIPYAEKVSVIGMSEDGWALVKIDEKTYFCRDEFLSLEKPKVEVKKTVTKNTANKTQSSYTAGNGTTSLGVYSLTAYCNCSKCCGKWAGGATASGTTPTQGRTVACNSLPFGTKISINGNIYTVEDTGNMADNVIDIYFNSHSEALQFGRRSAEVFLVQ